MKRTMILCVAMLATMFTGRIQAIEFAYDAGAEVVSAYIWRGQYNGGLSLQPAADIGFDAADEKIQFRIGAWGSLGASDWAFIKDKGNGTGFTRFIPELDITASLKMYGLTLGATHYYYFGGTPFFSKLTDDGGSQTEVQVGYDFGDFTPVKLYFNWYTMVAGDDDKNKYNYEDDPTLQPERAWSSYVEIGYNFELPLEIILGVQVGFTPWKSFYTDYEGNFAVNNIQARLGKTFELGDLCELEIYALGSLNTYGLNKNNIFIWKAGDDKLYQQRMNGCIGVGVWF